MSSLGKKNLERRDIKVDLLEPNQDNPNEMSEQQFNLLYDNMERMGITDPLLVRPHPNKEGMFRVVGGHHRLEVAKLIGYEEVPCTVIVDESFSEDEEKFQMVRHNIIKGSMSPKKFMELYDSLNEQYSEEVAAEMFGFADEDEFKKLIKSTEKNLPKELQQEFHEAAKEIKTIEDLASILNRLFNEYGDTLDYGYMIVDFGGKDSIWLRLGKSSKKDFESFASVCKKNSVSVDSVFRELLRSHSEVEGLADIISRCDKIEIPSNMEMPIEEVIEMS